MSFCWFCRAAAQIAKYVAGIDAHKLNAYVKFTHTYFIRINLNPIVNATLQYRN